MSYSLIAKAETKELAKQAVVLELDKIISYQPVHAKDRAIILANANAVIDLLGEEDPTKDISVSCNGYLCWSDTEQASFTTVSVSCSASHVKRQ